MEPRLSIKEFMELVYYRFFNRIEWLSYRYWVKNGLTSKNAFDKTKNSSRIQKLRIMSILIPRSY